MWCHLSLEHWKWRHSRRRRLNVSRNVILLNLTHCHCNIMLDIYDAKDDYFNHSDTTLFLYFSTGDQRNCITTILKLNKKYRLMLFKNAFSFQIILVHLNIYKLMNGVKLDSWPLIAFVDTDVNRTHIKKRNVLIRVMSVPVLFPVDFVFPLRWQFILHEHTGNF